MPSVCRFNGVATSVPPSTVNCRGPAAGTIPAPCADTPARIVPLHQSLPRFAPATRRAGDPVGAEYVGDGRTHSACGRPRAVASRSWSSDGDAIALGTRGRRLLQRSGRRRGRKRATSSGWTAASSPIPIPASRFQPDGPHGRLGVDRSAAVPLDRPGVARRRRSRARSIYELHVGTFTRGGHVGGGRARAAPSWRALGITMIELMPVAEFDGRFGWGYDGVDLFAPTRLYGAPGRLPALRRPRARAGHRRDPRRRLQPLRPGRQLSARVRARLLHRRATTTSGATRSTSTARTPGRCASSSSANAGYWIDEFHLDGLRLDATQQIFDSSPEHILAGDRRARCARPRAAAPTMLVAENEPQEHAAGPAGGRGRLSASTRSGTTTSTTARWSR